MNAQTLHAHTLLRLAPASASPLDPELLRTCCGQRLCLQKTGAGCANCTQTTGCRTSCAHCIFAQPVFDLSDFA